MYEAIGDFAEGRLEAGRRAGTVAGGLTDFSTSGNHLGPDALAELENARAGLGANEIDLVFRLTGKLIGPEPVHFVRVEIDGTSCTVTVDEASGGGASDGSTVIDESEGVEFSVVGDAGTDAAHWFGVEGSMFFFELGDGPPVVRSARLPAGDHQLVVYPSPSEENADPIVCGELRVATVG